MKRSTMVGGSAAQAAPKTDWAFFTDPSGRLVRNFHKRAASEMMGRDFAGFGGTGNNQNGFASFGTHGIFDPMASFAVPEPATVDLVFLGLLGVGATPRRREGSLTP